MSQLTAHERSCFECIAHEISEIFSERGHHVTVALDNDSTFRDGNGPRSQLVKSLVAEGIRIGSHRMNLGWETGVGGSKEIHSISDLAHKIFRVRKVELDDEGEIVLLGNESILADLEPTMLGPQERWVFGYTVLGDAADRFFVAQVVDVAEGAPGHLVLAQVTWLDPNAPAPSEGRFTPTDEALPGFDDVEDDELDESA